MKWKILVPFIVVFLVTAQRFDRSYDFRIRTITAGIALQDLDDLANIDSAINFLLNARKLFMESGYEVQTIRISTQNLHELINEKPNQETLEQLKIIDKNLVQNNINLSIGALTNGAQYDGDLSDWVKNLVQETSNINFNISITSAQGGILNHAIKMAAEICKMLSESSKGGEANFRFTASANCPAGIPFFPAAFHQGTNSFALGLEYPNVITRVFQQSTWQNAEATLKIALETEMKPLELLANTLETPNWKYDGIDTSPAPGLDASIGRAIETLTKKPFGSATTLSACAIITKVIKDLEIKSCGYSGLMLPVIEDEILAKRAMEDHFSIEELLLFSSVSGTGLDVIPIAGNTSVETIEGVYRDVAALSLKYFDKALSVRLMPIPRKVSGQIVDFDNPYLTAAKIMKLN